MSMSDTPQAVPFVFEVNNNDRLIARILLDGSIVYGPDYTPDDAARAFWEIMAQQPVLLSVLKTLRTKVVLLEQENAQLRQTLGFYLQQSRGSHSEP